MKRVGLRKYSAILATSVLVIILIVPIVGPVRYESTSPVDIGAPEVKTIVAYTPHAPFNITCNQDFIDQGWPGSGTAGEPYLIEGLNITSEEQGIWVFNTTAHFIIQNCFLWDTNYTGVSGSAVLNSSHATVYNNVFKGGSSGLYIVNSTDLMITHNVFNNMALGGAIFGGLINDTVIAYNTVLGGTGSSGISLFLTHNVTVASNVLYDIDNEGISIWGGDPDCRLENNTVMGKAQDDLGFKAWSGISIRDSGGMTVVRNNVSNFMWGYYFWNTLDLNVIDNVAHDSGSGFYVITSEDSTFTGNVFVDCRDGAYFETSNRCTFENNAISGNVSYGSAVVLYNSEDCLVHQNTISSGSFGVTIHMSKRCNVTENYIETRDWGIGFSDFQTHIPGPEGPPLDCLVQDNELVGCDFVFELQYLVGFRQTIVDNTVNGKPFGYFYKAESTTIHGEAFGSMTLAVCEDVLVMGGSFHNTTTGLELLHSTNCRIENVEVTNSTCGVRLYNATLCEVRNSHLHHNVVPEMYGPPTGTGIILESSKNCTLYLNDVHHNVDGITLYSTVDSLVTDNLIYNNTAIGIRVSGSCARNQLYGNQIGWNGQNADCGAASNSWDDGVGQGNAWSDYDGEGPYEVETAGRDDYPTLLTEITRAPSPIEIDAALALAIVGGVGVAAVAVIFMRRRN